MKKVTTLVLIALLIVLVSGIIFLSMGNLQNPVPSQQNYKIISLAAYNASSCSGIGYYDKPNGFSSGIKLTLRDKTTGETIESSWMTSAIGSNSGGSEAYYCGEGIDSEEDVISVYASGYAPYVFVFNYPENQLATVEVLMAKSCSGGPSFFSNLELSANHITNKSSAEKYIEASQNMFYDTIKEQFSLEKSDYSIECAEADLGRGGYVKVRGEYKDGSPLELFYQWGRCTSGGADCGWSKCFSSTSDALFESVKGISCNQLSSKHSSDEYTCTTGEAYDKTEEIRSKCAAGDFEKTEGGKRSLSIIQSSGVCTDSVSIGDFNCIGS